MVVKRFWESRKRSNVTYEYKIYCGWFLLGFIPIYITEIINK